MQKPILRVATEADAESMLALYAPYVTHTTVSSEYEPPSLVEFQKRMQTVGELLPWLICKMDGETAGYGYASPHRSRAAYKWSAETSIYVAKKWQRHGIAAAIYSALFEILSMQGYYNIFVGITSPNEKSAAFHTAMGFEHSGSYHNSMYKFGQWRDVSWMAKTLKPHIGEPKPIIAFPKVANDSTVQQILKKTAEKIQK